MKILVTGGSGFLGINLIRYLLSHGNHQITSLDLVKFDYPEKNKIKSVVGDIRNSKLVDKLTHGQDVVIHTAAALPLYSPEDIFSTEVTGTKNLLISALKNKVKRFVHISSTAVYGIPDHHPLFENDRLQGVGAYGQAKIDAEKLCQDYRDKGLAVTILRPKTFVGPERLGVFSLLYEWAFQGRNFPVLGNGQNRYQLLDVEDLSQAIYNCLSLPKSQVNDVFNIGSKVFSTLKKDYQSVLDTAGYNKKIIPIPAKPAILALTILEKLHLSPLYKWVYETVDKDSFVDISKATKKINYQPKYSTSQALVRNYNWYLENRDKFIGNQTGVSHRTVWSQGLLNILRYFF